METPSPPPTPATPWPPSPPHLPPLDHGNYLATTISGHSMAPLAATDSGYSTHLTPSSDNEEVAPAPERLDGVQSDPGVEGSLSNNLDWECFLEEQAPKRHRHMEKEEEEDKEKEHKDEDEEEEDSEEEHDDDEKDEDEDNEEDADG
ncbi:uncharacterized protein LOC133917856 [Phragmites australis]|uniref:uncharacterized protein LOC133917856 n=1 Tax=Phragmites australis TaxID=29695 RepID=UPI002D7A3DC6|nr:uncharacterized protein LOC133917856 [Phragmites australis]